MANADAAFGLRPVRYLDGRPYNGASVKAFAFDTSTPLAIGDPLVLSGTAGANGIPQFKRAAAAGPIDAVVVGLASSKGEDENVILRDASRVIPATTSADDGAFVHVVPATADLLFEVQEDSDSENVAIAEVGLHANLIYTAPDTVNGISKVELDSNTAATDTTAGLAVKIFGLVENEDNDVGTNANWLVSNVKSTWGTAGSSR